MRARSLPFVVLTAAAAPALAQAPQQQVRPPIAVYWMSAETVSGFGAMGGGGGANPMDIARRMMGGGGSSAQRNLLLQLGSSQAASGDPRADHAIPAAMNMGPSLPLVTPKVAPPTRGEPGELPEGMERPRGRMKIYWGCGEQVRQGQPVVIDFAKLAAGQVPPGLTSRRVNVQTPPSASRSKTYGEWPNEEKRVSVPENASMRGDHDVKGNYSPQIRFAVGERNDFMPPVSLTPKGLPSGATNFSWQSLPSATGYFAMAMGATGQDEVVFWTSSEVQEMGGSLFEYLPDGEVARLVREKVVMSPQTTDCTVPGQVVKDMGGMPMLRFIGYGSELNLVHPPRPQDPKQPWLQEWAVKVRNRSVSMMPLSEEMAAMQGARRAPSGPAADQGSNESSGSTQTSQQPSQPATPGVPGAVQEGVRVLRGIFGR